MIRFIPTKSPTRRTRRAVTVPTAHKWYVLCVEAGKEIQVRANLRREAMIADLMPTRFKTVLVPMLWESYLLPDGQLKKRAVVKYDGYVFLNMTWGDDTSALVAKTRYAFGLLPHRGIKPDIPKSGRMPKHKEEALERWANWQPMGLDTSEAATLLLEKQSEKKQRAVPKPKSIQIGEIVLVVDKTNPFARMSGPVVGIDDDGDYTVQLTVLGHPVDRDFQRHQIDLVTP